MLLLGLLACQVATAQPPIPLASSIVATGNADAPIQLEAFLDHQCPDSKASWPILKQLAEAYGPSKIRLVISLFPLPYHHNAFLAAQGAVVVNQLSKKNDSFWLYSDYLFDKQSEWSNKQTEGIAPRDVIKQLSAYAASCCGVDPKEFTKNMDWGNAQNVLARVTWKHGASLGIYGTPQFIINGVHSSADESYSFSDWKKLLDPLLG